MTTTETINLIGELSTNLKSATDSNEELSEAERKYLYGLSTGMKIAADTIRAAIERENNMCKAIIALSSKPIKPDLGDNLESIEKNAEPQDMSEQERWLKGV